MKYNIFWIIMKTWHSYTCHGSQQKLCRIKLYWLLVLEIAIFLQKQAWLDQILLSTKPWALLQVCHWTLMLET